MKDLKDYNRNYKENFKSIWKNRFLWKGIDGKETFGTLNILLFLKNIEFSEWKDIDSFYKWVIKNAAKYQKWCSKQKPSLSEKELNLLYNHFIGALGEFFFVNSLSFGRKFAINKTLYTFDNVSLISDIEDYGIDACCRLSFENKTENAVIQIKFWNPFAKEKVSAELVLKAYSQGDLEDFIEPRNQKKPIIICWLGNDKSVSVYLKQYKKLYDKVLIIDKKELQKNLDNLDHIFWSEKLPDALKEFNYD